MPETPYPQLVLDILPSADPTFSNFVVGNNEAAVAALQKLEPGRAVYLWGPEGCGKSHLLQAAVYARPGAVLCGPATAHADFERLQHEPLPPMIGIDDVQLLDARQQAIVFGLYNQWRESAATRQATILVVTGDRAPLHMPLREDLRTRLGWDLVFRLELLSDHDKLAALQAHASSKSLKIAPEILDWLLTHYVRDMRQLTTLIDALDRYSLATKRPITLPLLKTMLAEASASTRIR